jgi:hypothetical protein
MPTEKQNRIHAVTSKQTNKQNQKQTKKKYKIVFKSREGQTITGNSISKIGYITPLVLC